MKYEDLKTGDIFGIEGTTTYPKLKLKEGYVDMRDKILNSTGNTVKGREVEILSFEKIASTFDMLVEDIKEWTNKIKEEY